MRKRRIAAILATLALIFSLMLVGLCCQVNNENQAAFTKLQSVHANSALEALGEVVIGFVFASMRVTINFAILVIATVILAPFSLCLAIVALFLIRTASRPYFTRLTAILAMIVVVAEFIWAIQPHTYDLNSKDDSVGRAANAQTVAGSKPPLPVTDQRGLQSLPPSPNRPRKQQRSVRTEK